MADKKPKEIYRESYAKGAVIIQEALLPERLPYMAEGFRVVSMEIRASGSLDNGQEFQEIRVVTEEVPDGQQEA